MINHEHRHQWLYLAFQFASRSWLNFCEFFNSGAWCWFSFWESTEGLDIVYYTKTILDNALMSGRWWRIRDRPAGRLYRGRGVEQPRRCTSAQLFPSIMMTKAHGKVYVRDHNIVVSIVWAIFFNHSFAFRAQSLKKTTIQSYHLYYETFSVTILCK